MNKKLLFIYYKLFKPGGVARVLVSLVNELAANGYDVTIMLMVDDKSSFYELDPRVKVISIDTFSHWAFTKINVNIDKYLRKLPKRSNIKNYIYDFGQWSMLSKWLAKNHQQYDIIISSWYKLSAQISINKEIAKKTLAWEHSNFEVGGKFWGDYFRPKYKNLKAVVCINKASLDYYKTLNSNSFLIPNMVGEPFESIDHVNFESKKNQLIYVGRLDKDKNVLSLIKAIQKTDLKGFKLKIIGDGPELNTLKKYCEDQHLTNQIEFTGRLGIDEIKTELLQSKIFLFMSKTEAFGQVLLEAMYCGNGLISYDCKYGPSDIITDKNGYLIPYNDEVSFIQKLNYLIANPEKLQSLNQSSYEDVYQWRSKHTLIKWKNILTNEAAHQKN
ncbi:glycosyltransferase [Chryseobacterium sp. T1]